LDFSSLYNAIAEVTFTAPTVAVVISIVLAIILLAASGVASGSEIAFFSLTPTDISQLEPEKRERDAKIQMMRDDSERTLATILCMNNFVNVTIIMLCNFIIDSLVDFRGAFWLQFLVVTILLTFLLLLFGEIIPKIYARQNPLNFCRLFVNYVGYSRKLVWPLSSLLIRSGILAGKVLHTDNPVLKADDLEQALELTDKDTIINEQSILKGIIRFGDETTKDVMTLRRDIVDIDLHSKFDEVLKCIVKNNYSRIPVSLDSKDNIKGILYIKDLLPYLSQGKAFHWQSLMRPPYFVPETKKIDDLLREFQENKVHVAIVVDEFGGTSGLVTLEDILEEIVGEIHDEYDVEKKPFTRINTNTYLFEGKTLLSDFCKALNIEVEVFNEVEGDADTLAGILLELKGDFLKLNERIDYHNFTFEVVKLEDRRISEVKVTVHKTHHEE
jgi:putative hemolysin